MAEGENQTLILGEEGVENIYTRILFDNNDGTVIWIAWCNKRGVFDTGPTEVLAKQRLIERHLDWRYIALSALMNQKFEGVTALELAIVDSTIRKIRNLDERLERRPAAGG